MDNALKPFPADEPGNLFPPVDSYTYVPRNPYVYFEGAGSNPFQFNATQFQKVNACWLSDAAMLAYSTESTVRYWCEKAGFADVVWYTSRSAQCFVAIRDEYVFVVFCGTQKPGYRSRMRDVLFESVDLEEPLVKFGHRGSINRRVNEALDELWVAAPTSTYGIGLGPMLATIGRDHPQATFWFTGHGFGGALATLAALQHMKVAGLYTFGSPMVGDRLFQRAFEIPAWRFVNNTDVLARLPIVGR